ncbi:MAG: AI-2E family transporter [bacterium]
MEQRDSLLDISWGTILKASLLIVSLYVLYQIKEVLVWFLFAFMISVLFEPAIIFLKKFKLPRSFAAFALYIGFFGIISLLGYLMAPMFVSEITEFSRLLPEYFEKVSPFLKEVGFAAFENIDTAIKAMEQTLNSVAGNILNALFMLFGGIFTTFFILSLAAFMSLEEKGIEKALVLFFPAKYENQILLILRRTEKEIGNWFLTRLFACLFVGVISFIAFLILKVRYPLALSFLAAVLNFIPIIGPVITGILIFIATAVDSVFKAGFVVLIFVIVQQVENNIFTPLISKKLIDLPSVLVLMSLAVGGILWGFLGAVLITPLVGILFYFLKDFLKQKRERELKAAAEANS